MSLTFAGNAAVNATILECFELIQDSDVEGHYLKRFKNERHDNWQVMNTFRELVIGGYFAAKGFKTSLARIGRGTPDWRVERGRERAIVEVFTKYADEETFRELHRGDRLVYVDENREVDRLAATLREKANKYREAAEREQLRVIVASALEFSFSASAAALRSSLPHVMEEAALSPPFAGCLIYQRLNGLHRFDWIPRNAASVSLPLEDRASHLTGLVRHATPAAPTN